MSLVLVLALRVLSLASWTWLRESCPWPWPWPRGSWPGLHACKIYFLECFVSMRFLQNVRFSFAYLFDFICLASNFIGPIYSYFVTHSSFIYLWLIGIRIWCATDVTSYRRSRPWPCPWPRESSLGTGLGLGLGLVILALTTSLGLTSRQVRKT
jgi:hypothetical protein